MNQEREMARDLESNVVEFSDDISEAIVNNTVAEGFGPRVNIHYLRPSERGGK